MTPTASGLDRAFKAEAAADVPVGDIDFLPDCFNRFHFESPLYKFHEDYRIFPLTFDRSTGACRMQYNIYYIIIFKKLQLLYAISPQGRLSAQSNIAVTILRAGSRKNAMGAFGERDGGGRIERNGVIAGQCEPNGRALLHRGRGCKLGGIQIADIRVRPTFFSALRQGIANFFPIG